MANKKEGSLLGSVLPRAFPEVPSAGEYFPQTPRNLTALRREALQMAISAFGGTSKETVLDGAKAFAAFLEKGE